MCIAGFYSPCKADETELGKLRYPHAAFVPLYRHCLINATSVSIYHSGVPRSN